MANLQKRTGTQLSRRQRESGAYRAIQVGAVSGVGFAVTTVLWIAGALGGGLPVVFAAATAICVYRLRALTRKR
jgi:Flp pilus assembly protein TadB